MARREARAQRGGGARGSSSAAGEPPNSLRSMVWKPQARDPYGMLCARSTQALPLVIALAGEETKLGAPEGDAGAPPGCAVGGAAGRARRAHEGRSAPIQSTACTQSHGRRSFVSRGPGSLHARKCMCVSSRAASPTDARSCNGSSSKREHGSFRAPQVRRGCGPPPGHV